MNDPIIIITNAEIRDWNKKIVKAVLIRHGPEWAKHIDEYQQTAKGRLETIEELKSHKVMTWAVRDLGENAAKIPNELIAELIGKEKK